MAASAVTKTISQISSDQRNLNVRGTIAIAAGDYATPGLTLDLSSGDLPVSADPPLDVRIYSKNAATGLYVYRYTPGSNNTNGKVQIFTGAAAQSPLTELADGATPADVVADTIAFTAVFQKFV